MDDNWGDRLARGMMTAATRRAGLAVAVGIFVAGLPGRWAPAAGAAKAGDRKHRHQRRHRHRGSGGRTLFPDLQTLPPKDLRFDQIEGGSYVLRLTNTVWNAGKGRLELQASTQPPSNGRNPLYQNLYDAPVGGKLVDRRRVRGRIIYHPSHQHYHFADFASYLLLKRDEAGTYQPAGQGTKTSFCITDNVDVDARQVRQYTTCQQELQGLTPGWGDTYTSNLPDQWIVLGAEPLAEGEYAVQSTADPKGLLAEGTGKRETNNAATTYFSVVNGALVDERATPERTPRRTPERRS